MNRGAFIDASGSSAAIAAAIWDLVPAVVRDDPSCVSADMMLALKGWIRRVVAMDHARTMQHIMNRGEVAASLLDRLLATPIKPQVVVKSEEEVTAGEVTELESPDVKVDE